MEDQRKNRVALLVFLAVALLYAGPGLRPGWVLLPLDILADMGICKPDPNTRVSVSNRLLSDPVLLYEPGEAEIRRTVAEGRVPWTNPYAGSGTPVFADPQMGLFSPFTWLRIAWRDTGWALSVAAKLLVAGIGLFIFARRLGASRRAAILSAVVYQASGFSVLWALHPQTNVFAALPWLGAAAVGLWRERSSGSVVGVVAAAALATSGGHPETLAFGVCALAMFLLLVAVTGRDGERASAAVRLGWVAAAAACGFLLLAVQLLPFALRLPESWITENRTGGLKSGFQPYAIPGLILPGYLGTPLRSELDVSQAFFGSGNLHTRSAAFIGLISLVCLALGGRALHRPYRRGLVIAAVALAVAWGVPPLGWLWDRTPGLRLFAAQYAAGAFVLFAAVAVGPAVESLATNRRRHRGTGAVLVAAGLLLGLAGGVLALPWARSSVSSVAQRSIDRMRQSGSLKRAPEIYEARFQDYLQRGRATVLRRLAIPGFFWTLGGLAFLSRNRRVWLECAILGELGAFGLGYLPAVERAALPAVPPALEALTRTNPRSSRMAAASVDIYPPDLLTLARRRDVRAFDILESRAWIAGLRPCGYNDVLRSFPERLSERQAACLTSLGVGYFLARYPPPTADRIGGLPSPGVGLYMFPPGPSPEPPHTEAPAGLAAGAAVSAGACLLTAALAAAARRARESPV